MSSNIFKPLRRRIFSFHILTSITKCHTLSHKRFTNYFSIYISPVYLNISFQMVYWETDSIGCASLHCDGSTGDRVVFNILICLYSPGHDDSDGVLYKEGVACSECDVGHLECSNDLCSGKEP